MVVVGRCRVDPARQASKRRQHSAGGEYQPSSFVGPGRLLPSSSLATSSPSTVEGAARREVGPGRSRRPTSTHHNPKNSLPLPAGTGDQIIHLARIRFGAKILFLGEKCNCANSMHQSWINGPIYNSKHLYRVTCQIFLDFPPSTNRWDQIRSDLILAPREKLF